MPHIAIRYKHAKNKVANAMSRTPDGTCWLKSLPEEHRDTPFKQEIELKRLFIFLAVSARHCYASFHLSFWLADGEGTVFLVASVNDPKVAVRGL